MGCNPMLTKNANFVTNALTGDLSTVYVLALLDPEIPSPLDVTGKNNVDVFWPRLWLLLPLLYVWMWWK